MDKFQALRYFVSVAEKGSYSAAAHAFGVTASAVKKLVYALERDVGCPLFQPRSRGVSLTVDGAAYYESCRRLLEELAAAEAQMTQAHRRPSGVLRVGMNPVLARNCVAPALPRFHARYPDIEIDSVVALMPGDTNQDVDVFVLLGWPSSEGLIARRVAQQRYVVCAAPAYWERAGMPREPKDLARLECALYRAPVGTVLDRWIFERGGETQVVDVRGFLVSDDRDVLLQVVLAGGAYMRVGDVAGLLPLSQGALVPVLLDWNLKQAPPVNVIYRPNQRRLPRVQVFVDFLVELFQGLEAKRVPPIESAGEEPPIWVRTRPGRSSAVREQPAG